MDYYGILGVPKDASQEDIEKAWKKKRIKAHPDKGGTEEGFQQLQEAYETLSDVNRRRQYDNPQQHHQQHHQQYHYNNFEDMPPDMQAAFRRAGFGPPQKRNPNGVKHVTVPLKDAYNGCVIDVTPPWEEGPISINLDPGTRPQSRYRLTGLGQEVYTDLPRGDLHVVIDVPREELWDISGNDLVRAIHINAIEAMIGTKKEFEHLSGKKYKVTVPAGTNHADKQRMKGLGMPVGDFKGDLWVVFLVNIPKITDDKQVEKLKEVHESLEKEEVANE